MLIKKIYNSLKKKIFDIFGVEYQKVDLTRLVQPIFVDNEISIRQLSKKSHKQLHKYLKSHSGILKTYIENLLFILKIMSTSKKKINFLINELINLTNSISAISLPPKRWLSIYELCFNYGLFDLTLALRQKAIQSAFAEAKSEPLNKFKIKLAFKGAIDQGEFLIAKKYLAKLKKLRIKPKLLNEYIKYFYIQNGNYNSDEFRKNIISAKDIRIDKSFLNLISGKSVAVVGPAPSSELIGSEIDSYDIVVRTNYQGQNKLGDPKEFGVRTDISYYNGYDSLNIHKNKNFDFFTDLKASAFKSINHPFQKNLLNSGYAHKIIQPKLLFNGFPLQGVNIIYDLLHYTPSKIKIFKNNLFLSKTSYYKKYRDSHLDTLGNINNSINERLSSFTTHDLISQFNFLKYLKNSPDIEFDVSLKCIVEMDLKVYLTKLKQIYV